MSVGKKCPVMQFKLLTLSLLASAAAPGGLVHNQCWRPRGGEAISYGNKDTGHCTGYEEAGDLETSDTMTSG